MLGSDSRSIFFVDQPKLAGIEYVCPLIDCLFFNHCFFRVQGVSLCSYGGKSAADDGLLPILASQSVSLTR